MQRVRMSLPYFAANGWDAEVVTVNGLYMDVVKDDLLLKSIPESIKIHTVNALDKSWTAKLGLGSIALRSLWFYRKKVNQLLKTGKYDLVYFSTTQYPVCILGAYWKKRFGVPYIIDMQDPWHSDYYEDKPKHQRPTKYWFSYRLNKYLEPLAIKKVGGLISVSEKYIADLKDRYPAIKNIPAAIITFGAFEPDIKIARDNLNILTSILDTKFKSLVYVGRGGEDMHKAITPLFEVMAKGLIDEPEMFSKLKVYFIGTSYAPGGRGTPTILPLAKQYRLEQNVIEITDRISYYHTLITLLQADALFVPGSDDPAYTASKIYPYLLTGKPLLTIFNPLSPAINTLNEYDSPFNYSYDTADISSKVFNFLKQIIAGNIPTITYNAEALKKHSAQNMTLQQCDLFNRVIK